ncbi:MAG: site-specific DNA-methyltransferase, partial [Planctomycetota bacterium]
FTFHYDQVAVPSARMTTYNDARQNPKGKLPDDTWVLKFPAMENWHIRPQDAAGEGAFDAGWDTWYQSRLAGTFKEREQWHPCQLPEALLERIIRCSSNEGDLVFDPFAGSGTTLAVANRLQREWLGCELSPEYRKKALQRIKADPAEKAAKPVVTKNGHRAGARRRNAVAKKSHSSS